MVQPRYTGRPPRAAQCLRVLCCLAALSVALFAGSDAQAQLGSSAAKVLLGAGQQKPAPTTNPSPPPAAGPTPPASSAIPLPDVAARAEDLKRTLRNISNQLPTPDQLNTVRQTLNDRDAALKSKRKETDAILAGAPSTLELREEERYWRVEQADTDQLRQQLLDWANAAQ